jgi:hypothetical protein
MNVRIDPTGHDQVPAEFDRFLACCGEIRRHRLDQPIGYSNVLEFVAIFPNDKTTAEHQIEFGHVSPPDSPHASSGDCTAGDYLPDE